MNISLRVVSFVLCERESGRAVGQALVCPAARYASVAWTGTARPDRRFARPADWQDIDGAMSLGLTGGVMEADSPWVRVLLPTDRREGLAVQYIGVQDVEAAAPSDSIVQLDALLRSLAA